MKGGMSIMKAKPKQVLAQAKAVGQAVLTAPKWYTQAYKEAYIDGVKNANWYRKLTIKERGLVVQSLDEIIAKNPDLSQGQLARLSREKWEEHSAKTGKGTGEGMVKDPQAKPVDTKVKPEIKTDKPVVTEKPSKVINDIEYTTTTTEGGKVVVGKYTKDMAGKKKGDTFIDDIKVDESKREQGIGSSLLKETLEKYPNITGQASNDIAVKMNYKLGMRAFDSKGKELTLEQTLQNRKDNTSVMMRLPDKPVVTEKPVEVKTKTTEGRSLKANETGKLDWANPVTEKSFVPKGKEVVSSEERELVSVDQMYNLSDTNPEGFTVTRNGEVISMKEGYVVGLTNGLNYKGQTLEDVHKILEINPDLNIGGWISDKTGREIDVNRIIMNREDAIKLATSLGQEAIWSFKDGGLIEFNYTKSELKEINNNTPDFTKELGEVQIPNKRFGSVKKPTTEMDALHETSKLLEEAGEGHQSIEVFDKGRTIQDNIDDPLNPETPENAALQIEAGGMKGTHPSEVQITGQNYQEVVDGVLMDRIKLYEGSDLGTLIHERAETYWKRSVESNLELKKQLVEELNEVRENFPEHEGLSPEELFSRLARDNAMSDKKLPGKFGKLLRALLDKFKKYTKNLSSSAKRFKKLVDEGKISKKLHDALRQSVSGKIKGGSVKDGKVTYEAKQKTALSVGKKVANKTKITLNRQVKHGAKRGVSDVKELIKNDKEIDIQGSLKWYRDRVDTAIKTAAIEDPRITESIENEILFKSILTITSNGTTLSENYDMSFSPFNDILTTGQFKYAKSESGGEGNTLVATNRAGKNVRSRRTTTGSNALFIEKLINKLGKKDAMDWLVSSHSGRDVLGMLNELLGQKSFHGKLTNDYYGAAAFGFKLERYFMNLNGVHDQAVFDIWWTRTWNRWQGSPLETFASGERAGKPKLHKKTGQQMLRDQPRNHSEIARMDESVDLISKQLTKDLGGEFGEITKDAVQALLWYYEKEIYAGYGLNVPVGTNYSDIATKRAKEKGLNHERVTTSKDIGTDGNIKKTGTVKQEKQIKGSKVSKKSLEKDSETTSKVKTGQQNAEFFTGKAKKLSSKVPYKPFLSKVKLNTPMAKAYDKYNAGGIFIEHIGKMIPGFKEKQMMVGDAIVKGGFKSFLDVGASEGGLVKAVASENPKIRAVAVDPNPQMQKNYNQTPEVKNAEYKLEALGASWREPTGEFIKEFKTKEKFDVINEDYTFQFISNDRAGQVAEIKKLLKDDGLFITSEKFFTKNFDKNENNKLKYQRQYFEEKDLTKDKQEIISGMEKDMVRDVDYIKVLNDNFKYVQEFWNAGNFKGYIASNNINVINKFKKNVGDLKSNQTDVQSAPTYEIKPISEKLKKERIADRKRREAKKAEIAKIDAKDKAAEIPEFIRKRRSYIDLDGFERKIFSDRIRKMTTEQEREIVPFLMENTVKIPDALGRPDLQELISNPEIRKKLYPVVQEFREMFKKYWDSQVDFNKDLSEFEKENYITHIWKIPENKRVGVGSWFTTHNKFQKGRYIETLFEGIEEWGLKPKYNDVLDIFNTYTNLTTRVLANNMFVRDIKTLNKDGINLILPGHLAPANWVEIAVPAMKNSYTQVYNKVHPDLVKPLNVIFGGTNSGTIGRSYDIIGGFVKKSQLSLSLFHHLALSEAGVPVAGIKNTLRILKGLPVEGFWKMKQGSWINTGLARDFIENGGQLGASRDIPIEDIRGALKGFSDATRNIPVINKLTKGFLIFNEKWDAALWDWLHDGFKVYAYENIISKTDPAKIKDMKIFKREMAQFVNDTFGGQNWDILMYHPNTVKTLSRLLLSADWTVSTMRQAASVTSIGVMHKSKEARKIRAKAGANFWLKAMLYFGTLINGVNYLNRKKDMEDYPEYYQHLKDKDLDFSDYTMFGNPIGNKTRLFIGRNPDGTEEYIRYGKQFKEAPEMIYDDMGMFNPLYASVHRVGAKLAPALQVASQIQTGISPSGFKNYDLYEKRGLDWNLGVVKTAFRSFVPFSTQAALRKDKEFKWYNLIVPSSKGTSSKRIEDYMYIGLNRGDVDMIKESAISAIQNGIDPSPILGRVQSRINQEYLYEITRYLKSSEEFREAAQKLYDEVGRPTPNYKALMKKAVLKENEKALLEKSYQNFLQLERKMEKHKSQYPELYTGFKDDE